MWEKVKQGRGYGNEKRWSCMVLQLLKTVLHLSGMVLQLSGMVLHLPEKKCCSYRKKELQMSENGCRSCQKMGVTAATNLFKGKKKLVQEVTEK